MTKNKVLSRWYQPTSQDVFFHNEVSNKLTAFVTLYQDFVLSHYSLSFCFPLDSVVGF